MIQAFEARRHSWADDLSILSWQAGNGPPVVMLHGYPQNHRACLPLARILASRFTVVLLDLRGYGESTGPTPDAHQALYSKRAMAGDVARVMHERGHARYAVVGHDRGGRVAHRLALDFPDRVGGLASLTVIPTEEMWERAGFAFGLQAWHWYLLAQPSPLPETLLAADPAFFLDHTLGRMAAGRSFVDADTLAHYHRCFARPEVRRAMIEDYRAAAGVDRQHDQADRAQGRRLAQPVRVLWEQGRYASGDTPVDIWKRWTSGEVSGAPVAAGHLMMEEAPDEVARQLIPFLEQHAAAARGAEASA